MSKKRLFIEYTEDHDYILGCKNLAILRDKTFDFSLKQVRFVACCMQIDFRNPNKQ